MPITEQQYDMVLDAISKTAALDSQVKRMEALLYELKQRVNPEGVFGADAVWSEIVAIYLPIYTQIKADIQTALDNMT